MNKTWLIIIVVLVVVFGGYTLVTYNRLVSAGEGVKGQWAQVESQYQRRLDLIPNLVSSVQGGMKQEKEVFGAIADARTKYGSAKTTDEKVAAANGVESSLARLLVVMENYPQLKSSETVQGLMAELAGTENRVAVERMRFNDGVKSYNMLVKQAPSSIVAILFGFGEKAYFEAAKGAEQAPKVQF